MATKYRPTRFAGIYWRGGTLWYSFQEDGHRRRVRLEAGTEEEAAAEAELIRADPDAPEAGRWDAEVREYVRERQREDRRGRSMSPNTARNRLAVLRIFRAALGVESPAQVTRAAVLRWHEATAERLSRATADSYLANVRPFFRWLREEGRLRRDPLAGVKAFGEIHRPRTRFLAPAEVAGLIAAAPSWELRFVLLAGFDCGFRKNEIVEARPGWFTANPRAAVVSATDTFRPKDSHSRVIPTTRRFREFLASRDWPGPFILAPEKVRGRWRYRWDPERPFREFMVAQGFAGVGCHAMRHSFASNLLLSGSEPYKVAKWMSVSLDTLYRTYGHLLVEGSETSALEEAPPGEAGGGAGEGG